MRRDGGFTLVELLVALAVFALMSMLAAAAVRAGLGGAQRIDAHAERLEEVVLTQAFLRRQLGLAQPHFWRDDERRGLAFAGGPDRVEFVADAPPQLGGGPHVFRLARAGDGLELQWRPLAPDADGFDFEGSQRRLLASRLGDVRFGYYGADAPGEPPAWRDAWHGRELPLLVRVEAPAANWPRLVVEPMLRPALR